MRKVFLFTVLVFVVFNSIAQIKKTTKGHFVIRYEKDVETYAMAGANILNFVWDRLDELGFKPPKKIGFNLIKSDKNQLGINTATQIIYLHYTSLDPSKISANFVYGLCHEMGHLGMSNITPNSDWMTKDYREGWADFFGDNMVALVYEKYGVDAWPNPYNYMAQMVNRSTDKEQTIKNGEGALYGFYISVIFWEKLVYEKGMDKIPFFFNQIKSNGVSNPNADKKFRMELVKFEVTNELLDYFEQNREYLIESE